MIDTRPATIVTGLAEGVYPLTPSPSGRPRFGLVSAGSVGDTVLVYRSVRGLREGVAYSSLTTGSEVAGPALALTTRTTDDQGVTTVTLTGIDGEVWQSHRERRSPSPYGGVRVEILPA